MKQHISLEQLQEIGHFKEFKKLYKLIRNDKKTNYSRMHFMFEKLDQTTPLGLNVLLEEVNIGKMIEILENNTPNFREWLYSDLAYDMLTNKNLCLCDALWEDVKEVIK